LYVFKQYLPIKKKGKPSMDDQKMEERHLTSAQASEAPEIKPKRSAKWKLKLIDQLKERNRKIEELTAQLSRRCGPI
jgi:hypothetical protein